MRNWKGPAAVGVVTLTLVAGIIALADLSGARLAPFNNSVLGFSEPHERRAFELLNQRQGSEGLASAERETTAALALSPYNNAARLKLVYIDALRHNGALSPTGLKQFAQSYDLVPLDHTVAAWRVGFALEHWSQLTPELRQSVEVEAMSFARVRSRDADIRPVLKSVHNPEGRLAAALWLRALRH